MSERQPALRRAKQRAEAAEAENAAYVEAYDLLANQGKADNAEAAALREKVKLVQEANEWWEAQGAGRLKGTAGEMAYFMLKRYRAALDTK